MANITLGLPAEWFLWYPQIEDRAPREGSHLLNDILKSYCLIFGGPPEPGTLADNPLSSTHETPFDLPQLSEALARNNRPIYVCGSLAFAEVVALSWEVLGLNLFDLPWFSPPETKAFKYLNCLQLAKYVKDIQNLSRPDPVDEATRQACEDALAQLQWARCHAFSTRLQAVVGHGARDHLQNESWEDIRGRLQEFLGRNGREDLPCNDVCGLRGRVRALLEKAGEPNQQQRLMLAQRVASLDCREYRLASARYFRPREEVTGPRFERIIVLENNPDFRKSFVESLKQYCSPTGYVIEADVKRSWQHYRLYGRAEEAKGDLIDLLTNVEGVGYGQILTCFDLDLGTDNRPEGTPEWFTDIFGGFWVMYGTANAYQRVPRMVVTGFRSQDLAGLAAGGCAYLLKPFTDEALAEQVRNAAVLRRVAWLCPEEVRHGYGLIESTGFDRCFGWLRDWLAQSRVELESIDSLSTDVVVGSDLVIVDLFKKIDDPEDRWVPILDPAAAITSLRSVNPSAAIMLVVPTTAASHDNLSEYYRRLPLRLSGGMDDIIKKPMWVVADGKRSSDDALGNRLIERLFACDFDVKYQVLIPVTAFVGRFDREFVQRATRAQADDSMDSAELYAPLIPYLADFFGLSARPSELKGLSEEARCSFAERLTNELPDDRMRTSCSQFAPQVASLLERFLSLLPAGRHLNLESWLRSIVDSEVAKALGSPTIHKLTEPLTRVFGGSTRYEFGVRGSWYKTAAERVDDMLITVEFCAQSSIMARQFIEATVVNYLRRIAGEAYVMVQEIPIRGYLK